MLKIALFFIVPVLIFSSEFKTEPIGDLKLYYTDQSKDYSTMGGVVYQVESVDYYDLNLGGSIGLHSFNDNYDVGFLYYFSEQLKDKNTNKLKNESTWYDENQNDLFYLGEIYIKKTFNNQSIKIGRQTIKSTLVDKNNRITSNSYSGIRYKNKDFYNLDVFYFNKISSSTLSNVIPYNNTYGFLGYGIGYNVGEFIDISKHMINEDRSTFGAIHSELTIPIEKNNIHFENLYVDNFFNTLSLEGTLNINKFFFKLGGVYQHSVGKDFIEQKYGEKLESKILQS